MLARIAVAACEEGAMTRPVNFSSVQPGHRVRVRWNGQEHDQHVIEVRSPWAIDVRIAGRVVEIPYGDLVGVHTN